MDPSNRVLDGGQDQTNSFAAARGDKTAMQPHENYFSHWFLLRLFFNLSD